MSAIGRRFKDKLSLVALCSVPLWADAQAVRVLVGGGPVARFDPRQAIGAGVDGHEQNEIARMLSPANVRAMLSAGLKPLTYRLRTELAAEAWHWNPEGRWSDPARRQGYWVSSAHSRAPILRSYGYRLPRRGNTADQANNDGCSRLDDGDVNSFWKSNPYLDEHYTGEPNEAHPQWIVADFGQPAPVNAVRIEWGEPYATRFRVEYATADEIGPTDTDVWEQFPAGSNIAGTGGAQMIRIAEAPVMTRWVRILMTAYSRTAPPGARDLRDRLGVAVRELYIGTAGPDGRLIDAVRHSPGPDQTVMFVSSTDPWHRAVDRDPRIEQAGFDFIFRSGLTNGLPMLTALPVLYDTPENAANAMRYLRTRAYDVNQVELGEEPEEQYVTPEDYRALYQQWASALRRVDPRLEIGGPSLVLLHANDMPEPSWTSRLMSSFRNHGHAAQLAFFSFEWYPFDDVCAPVPPQLRAAPELLRRAVERLYEDGVPRELPLFMTEYGYSAYGAEPEVTLPGALLNAEFVSQFLSLGGRRAYLYGYEPNELLNEKGCSWGNNMLFLMNTRGGIRVRLPAYYASKMLSTVWAQPSGGLHSLYRVDTGMAGVTGFAVHRPDGQWSVLLLNKDPRQAETVHIAFDDNGAIRRLVMSVTVHQYSTAQYEWHAAGPGGHPIRDAPPVRRVLDAPAEIELPPYSITVMSGVVRQ